MSGRTMGLELMSTGAPKGTTMGLTTLSPWKSFGTPQGSPQKKSRKLKKKFTQVSKAGATKQRETAKKSTTESQAKTPHFGGAFF